jgi:hypothetical protein
MEQHSSCQQSETRVPPRVFSAPRRYDLATLFVVTCAYALLFGIMRWASWGPTVFASVAGFITCVGAAQALLFGGKSPRVASLCVGFAAGSVVLVTGVMRWGVVGGLALCCPVTAIVAFGYMAGVLVGGVFLVAHGIRVLAERRATRMQCAQADRGDD